MPSDRFATTRWSLIQAAGRGPDVSSAATQRALEELCGQYWRPVYAFLRRKGNSETETEDLTQGFFVHLLSSDLIAAADQNRGRFRSFLLKSVTNFVSSSRRTERAEKRGGKVNVISCLLYTSPSPRD